MKKLLSLFALLIVFLLPNYTQAHEVNQSYIFLRIYESKGVEGRFEMNVRELNKLLGTSLPKDIQLQDIEPYLEQIKAYLLKNTAFSSPLGKHNITYMGEVGIQKAPSGSFVKIHFELDNDEVLPDEMTTDYGAFFEFDDSHSGFLITEYNWKAGRDQR